MDTKKLVREHGTLFSEELGINLRSGRESEVFKWFLTSLLFGKPIQMRVAIKTFREFEKRNVLTPDKILKTGWNGLVRILDGGGYVRYDFSTATELLEIVRELKKSYGSLNELNRESRDARDLERMLQEFKGVGPTTTNIFLRELRGVWKNADPEPSESVKRAAKSFKINLKKLNRKTEMFARVECALFRISKNYG